MNSKKDLFEDPPQDLCFSQHQEEQEGDFYQEVCLVHCLPIEYLCLSCPFAVLCSQCLRISAHNRHNLKTLQRSKEFLRSQLQEWCIRLEAKYELLEVYYEQTRAQVVHLTSSGQVFRANLSLHFDQLISRTRERLSILQDSVEEFSRDCQEDCQRQLERINLQRNQIRTVANELEEQLRRATPAQQAHCLDQQKHKVYHLLGQAELPALKRHFREPNWTIDLHAFTLIRNALDQLTVDFQHPLPQKQRLKEDSKEYLTSKKSSKERISKKPRGRSPSVSPFQTTPPALGTLTPKPYRERGLPSKKHSTNQLKKTSKPIRKADSAASSQETGWRATTLPA